MIDRWRRLDHCGIGMGMKQSVSSDGRVHCEEHNVGFDGINGQKLPSILRVLRPIVRDVHIEMPYHNSSFAIFPDQDQMDRDL